MLIAVAKTVLVCVGFFAAAAFGVSAGRDSAAKKIRESGIRPATLGVNSTPDLLVALYFFVALIALVGGSIL